MDFLNRSYAQLVELFRSMTPGARITTALLLAAVVISLGYLFSYQMSDTDMYLLHGHAFSSAELPRVQAALASAGPFQVEGNMIRVPRGQHAAYLAALAEADALPANFGESLLKTINNTGPFTTSEQREAQIRAVWQQGLSNIIRSFRGIEAAEVVIDTRKERGGFRPEVITTASVTVKPSGPGLDDETVQCVRQTVASAVAGLKPEQVTVVDSKMNRAYVGNSDGSGGSGGTGSEYYTNMRMYQESFKRNIQEALSYVPGAAVIVNVELDQRRRRREEEVKVDPAAVAISTREDITNIVTESAGPRGRPGVAAQEPNQPAQLGGASGGMRSVDESSASETQSVVSHTGAETEFVGLTPKKVTVAIAVPSSYFESIWRQRNPTEPGEEPRTPDAAELAAIERAETVKIRAMALNAIPHDEGADLESLVSVTTFTPTPIEMPEEPGTAAVAFEWFSQYWSTLGLLGVALFSLVMLRSMIRSATTTVAMPPEVTLPTFDDSAESGGSGKPAGPKRRLDTAPSLKDELGEMVRENPDAAANILRGWIGTPN